MGKQVMAYCRDSGGPGQERSVGDQRTALQQWADAHGYSVAAWYVDAAQPGTSESREQFQRMIADALRDKPHAVVVWDMARFARDQNAASYYRAVLRRAGVEVLSLNDAIPDGPLGRIVEAVIDFSSEHFIATARANIRRGKRAVLERGYIPGGKVPWGYTAERTIIGTKRDGDPRFGVRWVVDEAVAPLIRQAFALRAAGASYKRILETVGQFTRITGVQHLLRNPAYKGVYHYSGVNYPGLVPAIVDAATWDAAQKSLDLHPRTVSNRYLLTGLLKCAECGGAMTGKLIRSNSQRQKPWARRYYYCGRAKFGRGCDAPMVHADPVEQDVLAEVFGHFLAPEAFAAFVAEVRVREGQDTQAAQRAQLLRDIQTAEKTLVDLVDLAGRGVAMELVAARLHAQETELQRLRGQLADMPQARPFLQQTEAELRAYVEGLRDKLEHGDYQAQRWVLHQVVARVVVGSELVIEYRTPE